MNRMAVTAFLFFLILCGCGAEIDPSIANTSFGMRVVTFEFTIILLSLLSGIGCLIGGLVLTVMGITGSIDWIVEGSGLSSRLTNASPGVVLMIIGLWIVLKSRLSIIAVNKQQEKDSNEPDPSSN